MVGQKCSFGSKSAKVMEFPGTKGVFQERKFIARPVWAQQTNYKAQEQKARYWCCSEAGAMV